MDSKSKKKFSCFLIPAAVVVLLAIAFLIYKNITGRFSAPEMSAAEETTVQATAAPTLAEEADNGTDASVEAEPESAETEPLHSVEPREDAALLREDNLEAELPGGNLYSYPSGYIYAPLQVKYWMPAVIYITGGDSGFTLAVDHMKTYLIDYQPQAIMIFTMASGYDEGMTSLAETTLEMLETAFEDAGCEMSQVITSGISLGAYTAFECAAVMAQENLPVTTVVVMDAGLDWFDVKNMDEKTCELMAEKGIRFYIFEESLQNLNPEPLEQMQAAGIDLQLVHCDDTGHDGLCAGLLQNGVLSWALNEAELDGDYRPFTQAEAPEGIAIEDTNGEVIQPPAAESVP